MDYEQSRTFRKKDKIERIKLPLLLMNLNCVIPDELHLRPRITDRLLTEVSKDHTAKPLTRQMVRSLIEEIRGYGVHIENNDKNLHP